MHLARWYQLGTTDLPPLHGPWRICSVDGCTNTIVRAGRERTKCAEHKRRPPQPLGDACTVDGCPNPPGARQLCATHYSRLRRTGTTAEPQPPTPMPRYKHTAGYVLVHVAGHPLADHHGYVYEHRLVLLAAIGDGSHPCHHCGTTVTWGVDLETDHLDWDRSNNALANLVPSCHGCNTRRTRKRVKDAAEVAA